MRHAKAFTLIELSIVLVIIGLLVGAILAGQSLIRNSQLRAVVTEYNLYNTAYTAFLEKYNSLPGDMSTAIYYWGSLGGNGSNNACQNTATSNGTATCNGNGDGNIGFTFINCAIPGGTTNQQMQLGAAELTRFWQHLSNAGLLAGSYTGYPNFDAYNTPEPNGTNMPQSRITGFYWLPAGQANTPCTGSVYSFTNTGVNTQLTLYNTGQYTVQPGAGPVFTPTEAWNLDTKLDDGLPAIGRVTANKTDCTTASGVAPPGDANATYQFSTTDKVCGLYFDL